MKRFRFRLDQVLHVRRVQEDQARFKLLAANRDAQLAAVLVEERLAEYAGRAMPTGPQTYEAFERAVFMLDSGAAAVGTARATHREALEVVETRRTCNTWSSRKRNRFIRALLRRAARAMPTHPVRASSRASPVGGSRPLLHGGVLLGRRPGSFPRRTHRFR